MAAERRVHLAEELAEEAYKAYGDAAGWLNHQGDHMPEWNDLPVQTRMYWIVATQRVKDLVLTERGL